MSRTGPARRVQFTERTVIAIFGSGQMGAALAAQFVQHGARVISLLAERSAASRERALAAGVEDCVLEDMRAATQILSIVPPAQAKAVAEAVCPVLGAGGPLFIDANALSPATKLEIGERVLSSGGRFADAALIGNPPQTGQDGPRFYICGEHADAAYLLKEHGLDVRLLDGPVGTAAALKMCYAGLNKGVTALSAAVLIAADRSGVARPLLDEWGISQPFLAARSKRTVPAMYHKAYRWVAEFDEIAAFAQQDGASSEVFSAIARFFAERDVEGKSDGERSRLNSILGIT